MVAVVKRLMHFEAGPNTHWFYACEEHRHILESGDVMCFLTIKGEGVKATEPDEDTCYFCREG